MSTKNSSAEESKPSHSTTGDARSAEQSINNRIVLELPRIGRSVDEFAKELSAGLPRGVLYNYGADIVEVKDIPGSGVHIVTMEQVRFRTWIEQFFHTGIKKITQTSASFLTTTLSEGDAKAVLACDSFRNSLPRLSRVIDFPMPIRKGGKIVVPKIGYNEDLETYLNPNCIQIDRDMPLSDAKGIIEKILGGFCFKADDDGQSKCHAIARILTPYLRGVIGLAGDGSLGELVPFWNFKASRPRAGKDYLAQVSHLIYTGTKFEDVALPERDPKSYEKSDETRKRITSLFEEGRRFVHFANCSGYIDDKSFIQAITAPVWADRILGKTKNKRWPNEMDFSISGNEGDVSFKEDIEPRSRHIRLEYFEEGENSRTFPIPDLHGWILANRSKVLSAVHAIFRHWQESGSPDGKTPFTSFGAWARVIGGVMTCQGIDFGDPCLPHKDGTHAVDPKLAAMGELYRHCRGVDVNNGDHDGSWWSFKQVINEIDERAKSGCESFGFFVEYFYDKGEPNRMKISKFLRRWENRIISGVAMLIDKTTAKADQNKIKFKPALA